MELSVLCTDVSVTLENMKKRILLIYPKIKDRIGCHKFYEPFSLFHLYTLSTRVSLFL